MVLDDSEVSEYRRTTLSYDGNNRVWKITMPKEIASNLRLRKDRVYLLNWEPPFGTIERPRIQFQIIGSRPRNRRKRRGEVKEG